MTKIPNKTGRTEIPSISPLSLGLESSRKLSSSSIDNTKDPTFDRWFPSQAGSGSNNARAYVKGVFGQLFEASPTSPAPKPIVAEIVNLARDAGKLCKGSTRAYFGPTTGRFHVCRQGLL